MLRSTGRPADGPCRVRPEAACAIAILGVWIAVFTAGCPDIDGSGGDGPGGNPCTADADCEDGAFCNGPDTCTAEGLCFSPGSPCSDGEFCDEEIDRCAECLSNADCASAEPCTTGVCTDGVCLATPVACDDGDPCTADGCLAGQCEFIPLDCDDGDPCTADSCEEGTCAFEPLDCDDDNACTTDRCEDGICLYEDVRCNDADSCTDDSCNPATGCVFEAICADDQVCQRGHCYTITDECDDGAACTMGVKSEEESYCEYINICEQEGACCHRATGECVVPTCPKTLTLFCNTFLSEPGVVNGDGWHFTLGQDIITATAYDDTVTAPLEFNPGTGTNLATLQSQDQLDGREGCDQLWVQTSNDAGPVTPTLVSVEDIGWTNLGDEESWFDARDTTGLLRFRSVSSEQPVRILDSLGLIDIGIVNSAAGLDIEFELAATAGADDAITLELEDAVVAEAGELVVTIRSAAANGIERLLIESGGDANDITRVQTFGATTLEIVEVTGSAPLTVREPLPSSAAEIDCSASTGGCTLGGGFVSLALTGSSAADMLTGSSKSDDIAGGAGDDVIRPGCGADVVDLGTGSDVLDLSDLVAADPVHENRAEVSGFTASDGAVFGDVVQVGEQTVKVDAIRLGNITTSGDLSAGASAGAFQTVALPGNVNMTATAAILEVAWEFTPAVDLAGDSTGALLLGSCGASVGTAACTITPAAPGDAILIIAYQSGATFLYRAYDVDGNSEYESAGEVALFAILDGNIEVGSLSAGSFID